MAGSRSGACIAQSPPESGPVQSSHIWTGGSLVLCGSESRAGAPTFGAEARAEMNKLWAERSATGAAAEATKGGVATIQILVATPVAKPAALVAPRDLLGYPLAACHAGGHTGAPNTGLVGSCHESRPGRHASGRRHESRPHMLGGARVSVR